MSGADVVAGVRDGSRNEKGRNIKQQAIDKFKIKSIEGHIFILSQSEMKRINELILIQRNEFRRRKNSEAYVTFISRLVIFILAG